MRHVSATQEKLIDKIYNSDFNCELFDQALKLFPKYNTTQTAEAADWIYDQLVNTASLKKKRLIKAVKPLAKVVLNALYDEIYAGLRVEEEKAVPIPEQDKPVFTVEVWMRLLARKPK